VDWDFDHARVAGGWVDVLVGFGEMGVEGKMEVGVGRR
jgi:hypothetical protein